APGESKDLFFLIGQCEDREKVSSLLRKLRSLRSIDRELRKVGRFWDSLLRGVEVKTPDRAMNLLLNQWLRYQSLSCRIWGRTAFYQSSGALGFRDQLQDVLAWIHTHPQIASRQIREAAKHQFEEGDVLHWWHPPSGRGVRTRCSDDLLWLPFVTAEYVAKTGDFSILRKRLPFLRGNPLGPDEDDRYAHYLNSSKRSSLYDHCQRAITRGATEGPSKLPLIGGGDWNDGMNRVGSEGRGESVWLGWFLYKTLTDFADLCSQIGETEDARRLRKRARDLKKNLHRNAWDGQWYLRARYDDGTPLGSSESDECQVDSIAQSWAVLSDGADPGRMEQAMEAVAERLVQYDHQLILLFSPPFQETSKDPGYIKGYPPGVRENGGQYTHGAIWAAWAFAQLGQGARAESLFRLLNPIYHGDTQEKIQCYRVEPYVVAADVYSSKELLGRGGWTWYTGSAAWMYRLGLEGILGFQLKADRLEMDPCIPKSWPGFRLSYLYHQTPYLIQVDNPNGVNRGVRLVKLDGRTLLRKQIRLKNDRREHRVEVEME
ncbi:MAG TPA: hypothetical protein VMY18_12535, partial [Acidobacteriota bacterium]|nr:hypothetical protein [Acidobacteriota bacterium]